MKEARKTISVIDKVRRGEGKKEEMRGVMMHMKKESKIIKINKE